MRLIEWLNKPESMYITGRDWVNSLGRLSDYR